MRARKARHRRGTLIVAISVARSRCSLPASPSPTSSAPPTGPTRRPTPRSSAAPAARSRPSARSSAPSTRRSPARPGSSARRCRARSCASTGSDKKLSKNKSIKALNKSIKKARKKGYKLRQSQPPIKLKKKKAKKLRELQPQAAAAVHVQVDPGGGHRRSQQRPHRDHARALHGAEVALQADQRPGLRPVQDHQRQEPGRRGLLRLPVPLPERPEPDRGPRPRADQHPGPAAAAPRPPRHSRTPGRASAATCRSRAPASTPDDVTIDAGNVASGDGAPIGSVKDVGIRADRADGFVIDNIKVRHAREHDIYVIETDGSHLNRFKVAVRRRVRPAHLRRRPLADRELRWLGRRRLGPLSRRQRRPRRGRARRTSAATAPSFATATCTTARSASRVPTATPSGSTTTTSTTTRWASRPTSSPRPATPASRRTPTCSRTTTSTRTTSTPTCPQCAPGRSPGPNGPSQGCSDVVPTVPVPVGTGMWIAGGNAQRGPQQPLLGQLAPRRDALPGPRPVRLRRPEQPGGGLRPDGDRAGDLVPQPVLRQQDGRGAGRQRPAQRPGLLVGPGRHLSRPDAQHRQLLVQQHRPGRHGRERHRASLAERRRRRTTCRPTAPTARRWAPERAGRRGIYCAARFPRETRAARGSRPRQSRSEPSR